eukprot:gene23515-9751_t
MEVTIRVVWDLTWDPLVIECPHRMTQRGPGGILAKVPQSNWRVFWCMQNSLM